MRHSLELNDLHVISVFLHRNIDTLSILHFPLKSPIRPVACTIDRKESQDKHNDPLVKPDLEALGPRGDQRAVQAGDAIHLSQPGGPGPPAARQPLPVALAGPALRAGIRALHRRAAGAAAAAGRQAERGNGGVARPEGAQGRSRWDREGAGLL